jgi:hypothetical protein
VVPTFPKARYWLQRGEVERGRAPNERDRVSYFPVNSEPLFEAGVAELFARRREGRARALSPKARVKMAKKTLRQLRRAQ